VTLTRSGMPRRVLVTGGRDYRDRDTVYRTLDALMADGGIAVVIHGACSEWRNGKRVLRGADRWADEWAWERGVEPIPCPADWVTHGRAAGPIRNGEMLTHNPDLVVAFPGGKGTEDMKRQARADGVEVVEVKP
jgi:hypothetical protein